MTPETTYLAILGKMLAQKRKDKGWDQATVANKSDINRSSWSRIENGETAPDAIQLNKIAETFDTTPSEFLNEVDGICTVLKEKGVTVQMTQKSPKKSNAPWLLLGIALGALITTIMTSTDAKTHDKKKNDD